jgi:hypothetical protein
MHIAAIMPCRGRIEQTVRNAHRLLITANHPFTFFAVGGRDEHKLLDALKIGLDEVEGDVQILKSDAPRLSYWQALTLATRATAATHLIGLANDLIPGMHWLRRAVEAYQVEFGAMPGLLGFNGDSHDVGHACHFLIARQLLERYGGWPVWYDHNFGDTELCHRAIADRCYAKAPWALLFHDHPYFGGDDDAVYAEGRAQAGKDERLYLERKALGWPRVDPTR